MIKSSIKYYVSYISTRNNNIYYPDTASFVNESVRFREDDFTHIIFVYIRHNLHYGRVLH